MTVRPLTALCVFAAAVLLAGGCAWTPRPYSRDPLVRGGRALRADPRTVVEPGPPPSPRPPLPPGES